MQLGLFVTLLQQSTALLSVLMSCFPYVSWSCGNIKYLQFIYIIKKET